jgi:hypothetical protein
MKRRYSFILGGVLLFGANVGKGEPDPCMGPYLDELQECKDDQWWCNLAETIFFIGGKRVNSRSLFLDCDAEWVLCKDAKKHGYDACRSMHKYRPGNGTVPF